MIKKQCSKVEPPFKSKIRFIRSRTQHNCTVVVQLDPATFYVAGQDRNVLGLVVSLNKYDVARCALETIFCLP